MRTTITLDPDVAAAVRELRGNGVGVSEAVNALARRGLGRAPAAPAFVQDASDLGAPLIALDDVSGVLDVLEGDGRRE